MRIAIVGGHLTPALSVIEELPNDWEVIYIGRRHGLEGDKGISLEFETITKMGIPFIELKTGRFQRNFTRYTIPSLGKVPLGLLRAVAILSKRRPDVILAFGGYLSVPVVLAAKILNIRVVVHEQTLGAGAANKFLAKFADKVCISFETSAKYFPKEKTILTGNPVRKAILHPTKKLEKKNDLPLIYITGGSSGSHLLNIMVGENLSKLLEKYNLIHQVGAAEEFKDFEKLTILKNGVNNDKRERYIISKFFTPGEIGSIMKAADLVVSRAGINTISELIILQKAALLIPIPKTSANEQMENAIFFEKLGLGEIEEQKNLTPSSFLLGINKMMEKREAYKFKSEKSHFPKNAARMIINELYASSKNSH